MTNTESSTPKLPISFCLFSPLISGIAAGAVISSIFDAFGPTGLRGEMSVMNGVIVGIVATILIAPSLIVKGAQGLKLGLGLLSGLVAVHACILLTIGMNSKRIPFVNTLLAESQVVLTALALGGLIYLGIKGVRYGEAALSA